MLFSWLVGLLFSVLFVILQIHILVFIGILWLEGVGWLDKDIAFSPNFTDNTMKSSMLEDELIWYCMFLTLFQKANTQL